MEYDVSRVDIEKLNDAINGDRWSISTALHWDKTPQGAAYWSDQYHGRTPLDIPALKEIRRQYIAANGEPELKLEVGKFYKTRGGRKVGPMKVDDRYNDSVLASDALGSMDAWYLSGKYYQNEENVLDLISEWPEEPARDETTEPLDYAALAAKHGICITVAIGEVSVTYDGRE